MNQRFSLVIMLSICGIYVENALAAELPALILKETEVQMPLKEVQSLVINTEQSPRSSLEVFPTPDSPVHTLLIPLLPETEQSASRLAT